MAKTHILLLSWVVLALGAVVGRGDEIAAAPAAANPSVRHIQRTMRSLAGERNPGEPVRILFYGQSITAQPWWREVVDDLRRRYPAAKIEAHNRAIGGFISPALRRTAAHDLYPHYPDLLVFHVYGDLENHEAIINEVRETTTAEILLHTDHVAKDDNRLAGDDSHSEGMRTIAERQITDIPIDSPRIQRQADGSLSLEFTGNRVVAVADGQTPNRK